MTSKSWQSTSVTTYTIDHRIGARPPYSKSATPTATKPRLATNSSASTEQPSEASSELTSVPPIRRSHEELDSQPSIEISKSTHQPLASADLPVAESFPQRFTSAASPAGPINRIRLLEWRILLNHTIQSSRNLPHDQAFDVHLTLDLTNTSFAGIHHLDFTLSPCAKKIGDGHRQMIGEVKGTIPYANLNDLTIRHASLSQGLYRLEAFLTLISTGASLLVGSSVSISFPSGLFQVY